MTENFGEEQEQRRKRRAALLLIPALFLASLCCGWALFGNISTGEAQTFIAAPLHSAAFADYSQDGLLPGMRSLSISIIEAVIRDHDPDATDADRRATEVMESLDDPIPTVTPQPGDPSQTPSPSSTATTTPTRQSGVTPTITLTPTVTETATPGPSPTPTGTPTQTQTATLGPSPTPCKVRPRAYVEIPSDGAFFGFGDNIPGHAHAHDPDNVNPIGCSPTPEVDGAGIVEVEFYVKRFGVTAYSSTDTSSDYCAFGGNWPCPTVSVSGGMWPNSAPIQAGTHELWVRAKDNEGQWSLWDYVTFTISLSPPTPTPSNTPGPSSTPSPTNSPIPPSATPTPSDTPAPTATTVPSLTPVPSATPSIDPCSMITLGTFSYSGSKIWWPLTNGTASTILLIQFDLSWPFAENLDKAEMDGQNFWDGTAYSPASINSGWSGGASKRQVSAGQTRQVRFDFDQDPVPATGYSVTLTFDNGCVISDSQ